MNTSTKLLIAGVLLVILPIPFGGIAKLIGLACIIGGIVVIVAHGINEKGG